MKKRSPIILGFAVLVFFIAILIVFFVAGTTFTEKTKNTPITDASAVYPAPKTSLLQNDVGNQVAYPPPSTLVQVLTHTLLPKNGTPSPAAVGGLTVDAVQHITLADAKVAFDGKKAIFLDVRSAESYTNSHITGAISIPEVQIMERLNELNPEQWIIAYCS